MPTSLPNNLTLVCAICGAINPGSVIDIGTGHGKTGVLLRELLDVLPGRYRKTDWKARITGVEPFGGYANPIWDYAYDDIITEDALTALAKLESADLAVALDVWEHLEPPYAAELLAALLARCRYVLISTPKHPSEQGAVFGNPYEVHRTEWHPAHFRHVRHRLTACSPSDWVILLSEAQPVPPVLRRFGNPLYHLYAGVRSAASLVRAAASPRAKGPEAVVHRERQSS